MSSPTDQVMLIGIIVGGVLTIVVVVLALILIVIVLVK